MNRILKLLCIFLILCACWYLFNFESKDNFITVSTRVPVYNDVTTHIQADYLIDDADLEYYKNDINKDFEQRLALYDPHNVPQRANFYDNPQYDNIIRANIVNQIIYNPDSQNVHDTMIQKALKKQYNAVSGSGSNKSLDEVRKYIDQSELSHKDKQTCNRVVDQIVKRNAKLTNFNNDSEVDILKKTWTNGDQNVRDYLLQELKDCDNGYNEIYCPTGVASRIVNATFINDLDDNVALPKTRELIHKEMMDSAAKVRTDLESSNDYNNVDETQQSVMFKDTLLAKYETDYENILSKDEIKDMTKDWIDHV